MSWRSIVGHAEVVEHFQSLHARGNMPSTFLLVGPEGIGKRLFAEGLAEALLCHNRSNSLLQACGNCASCIQVQKQSHPDVLRVERPAEKNVLPIELFVGDREHRSETGLCRDIRMRPQVGSRKIAIIDDADYLSTESGNVLLKTLEEPPEGAVILLLGTSSHRQLRTILSRCQIVRFDPLTPNEVADVLRNHPEWEVDDRIIELSEAAAGSIKTARMLADSDILQFRNDWLEQLASGDPASDDFAGTLVKFAEAAGKEAAAKRERYYFVGDQAIEFYHQLTRKYAGQKTEGGQTMQMMLERAISSWGGSLAQLAAIVERIVDFQSQIESNANAANAVDLLLSDMRRLAAGHDCLSAT